MGIIKEWDVEKRKGKRYQEKKTPGWNTLCEGRRHRKEVATKKTTVDVNTKKEKERVKKKSTKRPSNHVKKKKSVRKKGFVRRNPSSERDRERKKKTRKVSGKKRENGQGGY